jgi:hypothetical protein
VGWGESNIRTTLNGDTIRAYQPLTQNKILLKANPSSQAGRRKMKTTAIYSNGFTTPPQGSLFSGMICVEVEGIGGKVKTRYFTLKSTSILWKSLYKILQFIHYNFIN